MAVLGYKLGAHDDGSSMIPGKPRLPGAPHLGPVGAAPPHPALCPSCGRKIDRDYLNPSFRVKRRKRDAVMTYDGYLLVSTRFRALCLSEEWNGVAFDPLPNDQEFWRLRSERFVEFDAVARKTRFLSWCTVCEAYGEVIGARPVYLKNVSEPLKSGFYRTDLEFASFEEQSPLFIVSEDVGKILKAGRFVGLALQAVRA
jgi:hypothetical protein